MRKSSVLLGSIAVACALGAAFSWWQLRLERKHVAQLERQLADSRSSPVTVQEGAVATASAPVSTPAPISAASATTSGSAAGPSEADRSKEVLDHARAWQERERQMLRDPGYRKMQIEQGRRRFAQSRADAIRVVGMTPAQADRVMELWAERNLRFIELGSVTGQPPTEAVQAQLKRAADAEQAELRALLGDEKYQDWNRYLASSQERAEVNQFRAQLADVEPLRAEQADALVEAIYSERQRRTQEYEAYVKTMGIADRNIVSAEDRQHWIDLEKASNQRIHDSMVGTLGADQLASLDAMLAANLAPVETELRLQLEGRLAKAP